MKLNIFAVFDSKGEAFIPPWFLPTIGLATRQFSEAANDVNHQFCKYPGDYSLFHFGTFDVDSGHFDLLSAPTNLGLAQQYKTQIEIPSLIQEQHS